MIFGGPFQPPPCWDCVAKGLGPAQEVSCSLVLSLPATQPAKHFPGKATVAKLLLGSGRELSLSWCWSADGGERSELQGGCAVFLLSPHYGAELTSPGTCAGADTLAAWPESHHGHLGHLPAPVSPPSCVGETRAGHGVGR